jgi:hypothetical protein
MHRLRWLFLILIGVAAFSVFAPGVIAAPHPIAAAAPDQDRLIQPQPSVSNETCLGCHGNSPLQKKLYNGDLWSLSIDPRDHATSVHGEAGIACTQCHANFDQKHVENPVQFPGFNAVDRRDASLKMVVLCQQCHADQYQKANDSVHSRAQQAGDVNAAICTDCHGAHTVRRLTDPATKKLLPDARDWVPQTCAKCHSTIYAQYKDSVHGAALLQNGNLDVPTCIDCHGVHNIGDPTTAAFRLKSPSICAKCHTDPTIMDKYGISTQVLNTYVADFHGTTVTLFQKESPDGQTNKPVCFDCHGVHDIARVDDPQKGLEISANLLKRCQVCHPNATANFPTAWLSHYIPSTTKYPLVYFVNQFYQIFIPGVLGGMAVLVVLDISSVVRKRLRRRKDHLKSPAPPVSPVPPAALAPDQPAALAPDQPAASAPDQPAASAPDQPAAPALDQSLAPALDQPAALAPDQPATPALDQSPTPMPDQPSASAETGQESSHE